MRLHVYLFILALATLTTLSSCDPENQAAAGTLVPGTLKRSEATKVRVLPVVRQEMQSALETTTVVESERHVILHAQSSGIVREVLAEEGDQVTKGQMLARLDQRDALANLEDSRIALQEGST